MTDPLPMVVTVTLDLSQPGHAFAFGKIQAAAEECGAEIAIAGATKIRAEVRRGRWTAGEDDEVRRMRGEQMTAAAIAAHLGRSRRAVELRAYDLGITRKHSANGHAKAAP